MEHPKNYRLVEEALVLDGSFHMLGPNCIDPENTGCSHRLGVLGGQQASGDMPMVLDLCACVCERGGRR